MTAISSSMMQSPAIRCYNRRPCLPLPKLSHTVLPCTKINQGCSVTVSRQVCPFMAQKLWHLYPMSFEVCLRIQKESFLQAP